MAFWSTLVRLLMIISSVQPQCLVCSKQCQTLSSGNVTFLNKIDISCNVTNTGLSTFLLKNNFSAVEKVTLKAPLLETLNLTKLSNVTNINFSENNLKYFNESIFLKLQYLNLSYNEIHTFKGFYPNLVTLDLSHNRIENVSQSNFKLPNLHKLNLSSNRIHNIKCISSEKLKYLDVSNNYISTLDIGNLSSLKVLDISNNSATSINVSSLSQIINLEVLNLSFNSLTELKDTMFKLPNLMKLDLKRNRIKILSQKCFSNINKLQMLDISFNYITTISPSTLQYLTGLVYLILAENVGLSSKDFGILLATKRLQHVDASKTNQIKIPSSLTRSVRYLYLRENKISDIQCGDLDSYPLLNILDLTSNNISYIEDDALGRLELLITLVLSENSLITVPHTLPSNLKHLFLNSNKIKQISNVDFIGLGQIKTLDLSLNLINSINDESFASLKALETLNLSGNAVKMLSSTIFLGTKSLKVLDLSGLKNVTKCEQQLCFPIPESEQLQELYLQNSSSLANRLMNDVAALKTLKQLNILNLSHSNLKELRKDLPTLLPRLNIIYIQGNDLNCSELLWTLAVININIFSGCSFSKATMSMYFNGSSLAEITTELNANDYNKSVNVEVGKNVMKAYSYSSIPIPESVNMTEISFNTTTKLNQLSSDSWFEASSPGIVYAFSTEMPSSHPGLFIMLLLPIALFSTCLIINYSRLKRNRANNVCFDRDVEIFNFSNELW